MLHVCSTTRQTTESFFGHPALFDRELLPDPRPLLTQSVSKNLTQIFSMQKSTISDQKCSICTHLLNLYKCFFSPYFSFPCLILLFPFPETLLPESGLYPNLCLSWHCHLMFCYWVSVHLLFMNCHEAL